MNEQQIADDVRVAQALEAVLDAVRARSDEREYYLGIAQEAVDRVTVAAASDCPQCGLDEDCVCDRPCKWCNDEGIVYTHDGEIVGPCECSDAVAKGRRAVAESMVAQCRECGAEWPPAEAERHLEGCAHIDGSGCVP